MARYLCFDDLGRCIQEGVCSDGHESAQRDDAITLISDLPADVAYLHNQQVLCMGPRPSKNHVFDYVNHCWVFDAVIAAAAWREMRDRLLAESDWTQLPDVPSVMREAWAVYRQALRDITDQPGFPAAVIWPDKPQEVTNG